MLCTRSVYSTGTRPDHKSRILEYPRRALLCFDRRHGWTWRTRRPWNPAWMSSKCHAVREDSEHEDLDFQGDHSGTPGRVPFRVA